jgi:hypothetical protein
MRVACRVAAAIAFCLTLHAAVMRRSPPPTSSVRGGRSYLSLASPGRLEPIRAGSTSRMLYRRGDDA